MSLAGRDKDGFERYFDSLMDKLVRKGKAIYDGFRPCSALQILEVEEDQDVELPRAYKAFLQVMGGGAAMFEGTDYCYPEILGLRDHAEYLLLTNSVVPLPEDAFVFMMHQGYQFSFIRSSEGDDPPVYHYMDGDPSYQQVAETFTGYIRQYAQDYMRLV
ncbi:MAG TPA: SMI1/KNR4 family protein [Armatimonadota bacterium]|nr:SMI1/KNR4 family protein [Armatimonadota bacterium]